MFLCYEKKKLLPESEIYLLVCHFQWQFALSILGSNPIKMNVLNQLVETF